VPARVPVPARVTEHVRVGACVHVGTCVHVGMCARVCVACVCLSLYACVSVPVSIPVSMRVCMCTTVSVYVTRVRGAVIYSGRDCGDGVKAIVMEQGDIRAWGGVSTSTQTSCCRRARGGEVLDGGLVL